ncbi:UNVERIFIED_CONTAM: putative membrane protein [Pseudacidovorax intermedius]|nr:putative membrane protein [Pseudacidovorax intermedius]
MDSLFLIFDIVNLGLAALLWWITIKNYSVLPDTIPTHFDFRG